MGLPGVAQGPHVPKLHEIKYVSRRAPGLSVDTIVNDIVLPSMRDNRAREVTGCLWFDDTRFVQIIEGARATVRDLYETIRRDDRHTDVTTLTDRPIRQRAFSRWGMQSIADDGTRTIDDVIREYTGDPAFAGPAPAPASLDNAAEPKQRLIGALRDRIMGRSDDAPTTHV